MNSFQQATLAYQRLLRLRSVISWGMTSGRERVFRTLPRQGDPMRPWRSYPTRCTPGMVTREPAPVRLLLWNTGLQTVTWLHRQLEQASR